MTYSQLVQRALAVVCFVAPLLFVVALVILALRLAPSYIFTPPAQANLSANRVPAAFLVAYFAHLLMIPAFFTLTAMVGQRAPRLAVTSAVMGLLGLGPLICGSFLDVNLGLVTQAGTPMEWDLFMPNGPRPEQLIMGLPILLYFLANILLGVTVWRMGVLPRWTGTLLIGAGLLMFDWTGPQLSGVPLLTGLLASLCLLVVYVQVGSRLWRSEGKERFAEARGMMVS